MEYFLLTFNLVFGVLMLGLYVIGLVVWKYYDKKQRLYRKDLSKYISQHLNTRQRKFPHTGHSEGGRSHSGSIPPLVTFPLSHSEMYPFEKQETIQSHQHTP